MTEDTTGGWTLLTLKEYMEALVDGAKGEAVGHAMHDDNRFLALEHATAVAMTAAEKATTKAEAATEKRFDAVNEFRGQLSDQAATLVGRPEYLAAHDSITDKISALNTRITEHLGSERGAQVTKGNLYVTMAAGVGVVSAVAAAFSLLAR